MVREMPTKREEKPKFRGGRSGRNPPDKPVKASSTTAMRGDTHPSTMQLMEAVVERSNGGASFTVKSEAWCLKVYKSRCHLTVSVEALVVSRC
jgi:hypothetical protein